MKDDWFVNPKTNEEVTFIDFARSEGRFAKHFDKDGNPSETLLRGQAGPAGELAPAAGTGGAAVGRPRRPTLRRGPAAAGMHQTPVPACFRPRPGLPPRTTRFTAAPRRILFYAQLDPRFPVPRLDHGHRSRNRPGPPSDSAAATS